ncbi:UDP-glucose/GDP-mannose dehydrogenase family protein [Dyadobacter sp. 676]|uniref:UDP-glucose 6-dehydrogenase n=1 Tax=Dyadobacter sp. 676 TaxID=3088362 RepID=A0AAU8FNV2_9BACT
MKIAVIGTGYVGLVTGTCFAETGNQVTCVDIDVNKVARMQKGEIPIYEPGLDVLFDRNIAEDRLKFTTDIVEGIEGAEVIFLALPTPPDEDGSADLKYILGVANDLGPILKNYAVIVDKSTVPVGTAEKVRAAIAQHATVDFDVVSNPEFLREGVAVEDFMKPDRVVVGTTSDRAKKVMEKLYAPLVRQGNPIIFMDERSAEMTKYAANSFLALKITFMNEIANLCERVGANVDDIRRGIGTDSRIGKRFLFAGIGYGGSCFPKDVQALAKTSIDYGYDFRTLKSVMAVNADQKKKLLPIVEDFFEGSLAGKTIAVWGLAFKPYTDDIREAPALENIRALLAAGAKVTAYDPEAMENVKRLIPEVTYCHTAYAALDDADALMIFTEWPQFRTPDFIKMGKLLKEKVVFDGRNLYELNTMREHGFTYYSIGREAVNAVEEPVA